MFQSSRFVTTERWSSRRTALALPTHVSISLLRLPSLIITTPRYLNFSTCCSGLPFTCSVHCLGLLERHNISVYLVLIFIPARLHAAENRPKECWRPCWEDASSTKSSAKSNRLTLQLPTVTPSSTQLWLICNKLVFLFWRTHLFFLFQF